MNGNIWVSLNQASIHYRASTRPRTQTFKIRLENESRVGTPLCRNLPGCVPDQVRAIQNWILTYHWRIIYTARCNNNQGKQNYKSKHFSKVFFFNFFNRWCFLDCLLMIECRQATLFASVQRPMNSQLVRLSPPPRPPLWNLFWAPI